MVRPIQTLQVGWLIVPEWVLTRVHPITQCYVNR